MSEHRWSYCQSCMAVVVVCGDCGFASCCGGSDCTDDCAEARRFEKANRPPDMLIERAQRERAHWFAMTPEEREESLRGLPDFLEVLP